MCRPPASRRGAWPQIDLKIILAVARPSGDREVVSRRTSKATPRTAGHSVTVMVVMFITLGAPRLRMPHDTVPVSGIVGGCVGTAASMGRIGSRGTIGALRVVLPPHASFLRTAVVWRLAGASVGGEVR